MAQSIEERSAIAAQAAILLNRQYLLTERLIETQSSALLAIEKSIEQKAATMPLALDAYNYVFSLIDHLVRYQKTASVLSLISQRSPQFRAMSEAFANLKDSRNQLQHLNNDIDNDFSGPLLGMICWANGNKQFMVTLHDLGRPRSSPSIVFDSHNGQFLHQLVYVYNHVYYDLAKAIDGMRAYSAFLDSTLKIEVGGNKYDAKDHFAAICMEFRPCDQSDI